jgi:hypothetical protein
MSQHFYQLFLFSCVYRFHFLAPKSIFENPQGSFVNSLGLKLPSFFWKKRYFVTSNRKYFYKESVIYLSDFILFLVLTFVNPAAVVLILVKHDLYVSAFNVGLTKNVYSSV